MRRVPGSNSAGGTLLLNFWQSGYPTLSVSFGVDTKSRQSLLAGVYMPGEVKKHMGVFNFEWKHQPKLIIL